MEKNAHYMPGKTFRRLVSNIKKDRNLSSVPFCWRRADGTFVVLSGNHRIDAAREAGVKKVLVLYTDEDLSRSQQIAIQLSHNAIVGADHKQTLLELWREVIDLEFKEYSGLDEISVEALNAGDIEKIQGGKLPMEDLHLLFLPEEIEQIDNLIAQIEKMRGPIYAAPLSTWNQFFETLLAFKEKSKIYNSATAILEIVKIVGEYLQKENTT